MVVEVRTGVVNESPVPRIVPFCASEFHLIVPDEATPLSIMDPASQTEAEFTLKTVGKEFIVIVLDALTSPPASLMV